MRSKGNQPKAEEKKWLEAIGNQACIVTSSSNIQVHHMFGASAKRDKLRVGHWAILPLSVELHDISSNHPHNITLHKKQFVENYGTEIELFSKLIELRIMNDLWVPPQEIINAITRTEHVKKFKV